MEYTRAVKRTLSILLRVATHTTFWGLHGLVVVGVGWFVSTLGAEDVVALSDAPWDVLALYAALVLAPAATMTVALFGARDAWRLARLFFGVEIPIVVALGARLSGLTELVPAAAHLLALNAVAMAIVLWDTLREHDVREQARPPSLVGLAARAVVLVVGLWSGAIGALLPIVAATAAASDIVVWEVWTSLGLPSLPWSATLVTAALLLAAAVFTWTYVSTYAADALKVARESGPVRAAIATVVGVAAWLGPAYPLDPQPHETVYARLDGDYDAAERRTILEDQPSIRAGLLDAARANHRYVETTVALERAFPSSGPLPGRIGTAFALVARPLVFRGDAEVARARAEETYEALFDVSLEDADDDPSPWAIRRGDARLERQEVIVRQEGDLAEVTIDEQYRNLGRRETEVVYTFSLPMSAAVTGVWLSDDVIVPQKWAGVVVRPGAAQAIDDDLTRVRPTVLEQVGPRQYRLRVSPIPGTSGPDAAPYVCARVTYTTPVAAEGVPLPVLLDRRNVTWGDYTDRVNIRVKGDFWLPAHVGEPAAPTPHAADGVSATLGAASAAVGDRVALVVDGSLSMRAHASAVQAAVDSLPDADLWWIPGASGGEPARVDALPEDGWFGGLHADTALRAWATASKEHRYDVVFVLTDEGLRAPEGPVAPLPALPPVWFVHLGGTLASAYDVETRRAIHGAATSLDVARAEAAGVVDGYAWAAVVGGAAAVDAVGDAGAAEAPPTEPVEFAPLAARFLALERGRRGGTDRAHTLATEGGVVTPWSAYVAERPSGR